MTSLILLLALIAVPVLAILFMRINGTIAFMSLCLGSVLVTYTSGDITSVFGSFSASHNTLTTNQYVQLGLVIIPFVLALLFTRGSVKGAQKVINLLPALATGLLFALLIVPLLTASLQRDIHHLDIWRQLDNLQTAVVLGGAAFSLLFLLLTHRPKHDDHKKHHNKH